MNRTFIAYLTITVFSGMLMIHGGCTESHDLERREVSGTVMVDGKILNDGQFAFIPIDGTAGPSVGGVITAGRFHLKKSHGPVPGTYLVQIWATHLTGRKIASGPDSEDPNELVDEIEQLLPRKYNSESEITVKVDLAGENVFRFELESMDK